jgi:hypothetical protein
MNLQFAAVATFDGCERSNAVPFACVVGDHRRSRYSSLIVYHAMHPSDSRRLTLGTCDAQIRFNSDQAERIRVRY